LPSETCSDIQCAVVMYVYLRNNFVHLVSLVS